MAMAALCAMLASGAAGAGEITVDIKAFEFAPREISIAPGTQVTWINHDQTIHNVVDAEGVFASPGLDTDDRFTFTFVGEGDFTYVCALHPHMTGTVHVHAR